MGAVLLRGIEMKSYSLISLIVVVVGMVCNSCSQPRTKPGGNVVEVSLVPDSAPTPEETVNQRQSHKGQSLKSVTNNELSNLIIKKPDIDILTKKAQQNNATAQYDLGRIYFEGSWLPKNEKLAAYWFRKSAEQNYAKAQFYMGELCMTEMIDSQLLLKLPFTEMHTTENDKREVYNKSESHRKESIRWNKLAFANLKSLSGKGDPEVQYMLLRLYIHMNWQGITEDKSRAADLRGKTIQNLKKAAEQGDIKAQCCLGDIYSYAPINDTERIRWYTQAARMGDPIAQYKLGSFYKYKKEYAKAIEWLTKAAEQGHIEAQYELGMIYYNLALALTQGNEANAFHNDFKAVEWLKKAAQEGHSDAQYDLASCYLHLEKIQDINEALPWYTKAAEQGHAKAQGTLAYMYFMGENAEPALVEKDYEKALKLYKRQAEQAVGSELADAQQWIARVYYFKEGRCPNRSWRFEWLLHFS